MYAGIDIGGSKTLVASMDDNGVIQQQIRFETPKAYDEFLTEVRRAVIELKSPDFRAGGAGVPGTPDRERGFVKSLGNLGWKNLPIQDDLEEILKCPVVIENDAKMAALSEAMMLKDRYNRVMYMTVSTGIGYAIVSNRTIDLNVGDGGGRTLMAEHRGKLMPWEDFASGRAIVRRYGKKAQDINDEETWRKIVRDLRAGLVEIIAILQPEVIVFGGSVGRYFEKWGKLLREELQKYETPMMSIPKLREAARPEEAVIYGCYDLAVATFGQSSAGSGKASVSSGARA